MKLWGVHMRFLRPLSRFAMAATVALLTTACATGGGMDGPDAGPDDLEQVFLNVLNDTDELTVTVSIEDLEGNAVPLGNVRRDRNERLIFRLPDEVDRYRLVAVGPQDDGRGDYVISPDFVVDGGATINWYLDENEIEVN